MFLPLSLVASAQVPPPLVGGVATDAYPAVVTLLAVDDGGEGDNFCSGTLVAPEWVLTAAHCLVQMDELRRTRTPNLVVAVGFDLGLEGGVQEVVAAVDTFVPTGFELSTLRDDIGLIRLAQPITSVLPMPVRGDAPSPCEVGADLRYVGWGTVADDELDTSVKRTVDIPLHHYDDARVFGYDPTGERNVCAGDSGGAVLSILPDGEVALVAVNSYVADDDDTPCAGGYTAGTRVDRQLPWIEGYVDLEVGTTAVSCEAATDVPSTCGGGGPSTLVLTLGGLAFAWRRTILAGRRTTAQPRIRR